MHSLIPNRTQTPPITRRRARKLVSAVDLFCGAGGLTRGLLDAGIKVRAGYDNEPACQHAYSTNNKGADFHLKSVSDLEAAELAVHYPEGHVRVLVGCAPCQPFSKYTQGQSTEQDAKWGLLGEFGRLVDELRPEIVSMENVPEMQRHRVFSEFVAQLDEIGYHVSHTQAFCPDYGVPQQRRRLVLLASLLGPIELLRPRKARPVTVRSAIGHLPPLAAGESSTDVMHRACRLSPLNLQRIRVSRPGGCWRDWPEELIAKCHQTEMGKNYPSVYGRMEWEAPAPTITTQFFGFGNGRFGHPEQDRALTLREGAILQSFPEDYAFVKPDSEPVFSTLGRLIGNAVPVRLGEAIGRSIHRHVEAHT